MQQEVRCVLVAAQAGGSLVVIAYGRVCLLSAHARRDELAVVLEVFEGQQRHGGVLIVDGGNTVVTEGGLRITASLGTHRVVLPFLIRHDQHAVCLVRLRLLQGHHVGCHSHHQVQVLAERLLQLLPLHYASRPRRPSTVRRFGWGDDRHIRHLRVHRESLQLVQEVRHVLGAALAVTTARRIHQNHDALHIIRELRKAVRVAVRQRVGHQRRAHRVRVANWRMVVWLPPRLQRRRIREESEE